MTATAVDDAKAVYLYPGQMLVTGEPTLVKTILGSCIAICMWDAKSGVAGINHYLLPENPLRGQRDARYGNTAIEQLIDRMIAAGASLPRITAKLVGGASIITPFNSTRRSIGEQNIDLARELLKRFAIPVVAEQVGGQRGRKLLFDTGDGSTYSREI